MLLRSGRRQREWNWGTNPLLHARTALLALAMLLVPASFAQVAPLPPLITSTYPVRGQTVPNATVLINRLPTPGDTPIALSITQADGTGEFLDGSDTLPLVGQFLSVVAISTEGQASPPSTPVLIETPCPLPETPDTPYPGDGTTLVPLDAVLAWDALPGRPSSGAKAIGAGELAGAVWEATPDRCDEPIDIESIAPADGVRAWDGQSFARQGVTFRPAPGASLFLARDELSAGFHEAYIESTAHPSGNYPADAGTIIDFVWPVTCVSMKVWDADTNDKQWAVSAYDSGGRLIAQRLDNAQNQTVRLSFPGIRRAVFLPSTEWESLNDIAFVPIDCPVRFDVNFGTSPVALAPICSDTTETICRAPALAPFTTYYWQVVAKGAKGTATGPIWSFTTRPLTIARNDTFVMLEDGTSARLNVLANDINPSTLQIIGYLPPPVGILVKNDDDTFTYTPPHDFFGPVQFTYAVQGAGPGSITTATVGIVVLQANDAPFVKYPVPNLVYNVNAPPQGVNAGVVFFDVDQDPLTFTVSNNTNPGVVAVESSPAGYVMTFAPNTVGETDITIRATDPEGLFAEDTFHVTLGVLPTPPTITTQPAPQTVNYRNPAQFLCAATSNVALSYRWLKDGTALFNGARYAGVDSPQLTVIGAENGDEGNYRCQVSNGVTTVLTQTAALTVRDPYIFDGPADTTGGPGGEAVFQVTAIGSGALRYQWFIGNTALPEGAKYVGATTGRLTVKNLVDNAGNSDEQLYRCEVRGADAGAALSRAARLVISDPAILVQPQPLTVREGTQAAFNVVAYGSTSIIYRWKKGDAFLEDSARIRGTHTPTLLIDATVESDESDYRCVVVGQEIVTSAAAALRVTQIPAILGLRVTPENGITPIGGSFSIEVLLDGPAAGLGFQWRRDATPLSDGARIQGATSTTLTVSQAIKQDYGFYTCLVSQGDERLSTDSVLIQVGLSFLQELKDTAVEAGETFAWRTVLVGGRGNAVYSWFKQTNAKALEPVHDDGRIRGTDSGTLTFDPVDYADAGQYTVYAVEDGDVAISHLATLTVLTELPIGGTVALSIVVTAFAVVGARRPRGGFRRG